jgi:hypothetical protein
MPSQAIYGEVRPTLTIARPVVRFMGISRQTAGAALIARYRGGRWFESTAAHHDVYGSAAERFECCNGVDADLALVGQLIQIRVLTTHQSVPHREYIGAGDSERLAISRSLHHVFGHVVLGSKMRPLQLKTQVRH